MTRKIVFLQVVLVLVWVSFAQADSRSASVQVSCTIPPAIGLIAASPAEGKSLSIYSNLDKNYDVTESWASIGNNPAKILTLTAR